MGGYLLIAALVVGAPALKVVRKPADPPAGDWVIESLTFGGQALAGGDPDYGLRVSAATLTRTWRGRWLPTTVPEPAAFFDAAGQREVDIYPADPDRLRKGIWKVEGDTLTVCEAAPGEARPAEFTAPVGSRRSLWVLRRARE